MFNISSVLLIRRTKWEISWNIWGLQNWSEQLTEHHPFPLERVEKWRSKLRKPTITLRFQQGVVYYLDLIWLVVYLPLWKMMEFVSWDDEIPNIWENKIHVPNHQPVMVIYGQGLIQGFIQSFQTASPTSQARKFIACNFVSCSSWPSRCRMSCQAISSKLESPGYHHHSARRNQQISPTFQWFQPSFFHTSICSWIGCNW